MPDSDFVDVLQPFLLDPAQMWAHKIAELDVCIEVCKTTNSRRLKTDIVL